jgi:hypothetical protein
MKYPKEWPGFEDWSGSDFGAVEFTNLAEDDWQETVYRGFVRCFIVATGGLGLWKTEELKPLTPAAEDMLALIRERGGTR